METAEKITLFCFFLQGVCGREFNIILQEKKIQVLSGSCVIIKCRFEIHETYDNDLTERAAGVWFVNGTDKDKNLVFNSSAPIQNSLIMGNITGKLKDKDCTTVFYDARLNHTGQYYFRIEGDGELKWTFPKTVSVDVIESPVKLYEEQKEPLEVLEGIPVSLRCSADTLCPSPTATFTWSSTRNKLWKRNSPDLNFTAAPCYHNVTFTCSVNCQQQGNNKRANSSITLHVQYAPQISNSSSCNSTVCFCEVDGNPSPEVQWLLSGRPVSNSSDTFISEERWSSTGLRSFISLRQSLTNTNTLQCFSNNTHSKARELVRVVITQECGNHVLIGVAAVALVIAVLCVVAAFTYAHVRTNNGKLLQTTQEGGARGRGENADKAVDQENEGEDEYVTMSFAGVATENQLIHDKKSIMCSSIDFTNSKPRSQEVESISSLHNDYATVQRSKRESSKATEVQVIVSVDVVTKQTESVNLEEDSS